ncbi:hypothetical protein [Williamsia sp. D3]|uniref:hypothetical protein n=1 Tax=Williamsia sp. D3 TaxID=1313067 RepID=UPI0003D378C6|nr:hypothetical protein [Williamsia sp. D3]ETD30744.1 hypothetical protein W823_22980 [Williamsia sp. D3]
MSLSDLFDNIAARVGTHSAEAVAGYRKSQQALGEKVRTSVENATHGRGVTRTSVAASGAILLPANDIDLSPHTPYPAPGESADNPTAGAKATLGTGAKDSSTLPGQSDVEAEDCQDTGFSCTSGWLSDR